MKPKQPGVKFQAANGDELEQRQVQHGVPRDKRDLVLVSAMAVVKAGNKVVLSHEAGGSCIENVATGKRIKLKESDGIFVFEFEFDCGSDASLGCTPVFSRRG